MVEMEGQRWEMSPVKVGNITVGRIQNIQGQQGRTGHGTMLAWERKFKESNTIPGVQLLGHTFSFAPLFPFNESINSFSDEVHVEVELCCLQRQR